MTNKNKLCDVPHKQCDTNFVPN